MIICRCDLADAPVPGTVSRPSLAGMKRASEVKTSKRDRGPSEDNDDDDDRVEEEDEEEEGGGGEEGGEGDVFLRRGRNK